MASLRDRVIYSTIELVRRRGVVGTGVADIVEASGTSRKTIYKEFPSGKSQVVAEATAVAGKLLNTGLLSPHTAENALDQLVHYWTRVLVTGDYRDACPVAMAALGSYETPQLAGIADDVFGTWQASISDQLVAQGLPVQSAESFASLSISAIEGAVIRCIAARDTTALTVVHQYLRDILDRELAGNENT